MTLKKQLGPEEIAFFALGYLKNVKIHFSLHRANISFHWTNSLQRNNLGPQKNVKKILINHEIAICDLKYFKNYNLQ